MRVLSVVVAIGLIACGKSSSDKNQGSPGTGSATGPSGPAAGSGSGVPARKPRLPRKPSRGSFPDLPIASAKIVYRVTGMEEGTVTIWFTDNGQTAAMKRELTSPQAGTLLFLWKDGQTTTWHPEPGGEVTTSPFRPKATEMRLVSTTDPAQLEAVGYVKQVDGTIAGQPCAVWRNDKQDVTLWRWNDIDLKYVNRSVGSTGMTMEATSVETPATIPPEMLAPPNP